MPGGSDPGDRVGRCSGYKCSCQAYEQAKPDRVWPVCRCRHVLQSHARPAAAEEVAPCDDADAS